MAGSASGLVFVRYLLGSYRPEGCEEAHNKSCRYSQAPPRVLKPELTEFDAGLKPLKFAGLLDL